jgi:hypothetical protein
MPNTLPGLQTHLPGRYLGSDALAAVTSLANADAAANEWSPSKRVLDLVDSLQVQRLKIAGQVVAELIALTSKAHPNWDALQLNAATLFLLDSLACALAFDVPDLMDMQHKWLNAAMPPRAVSAQLIDRYLQNVEAALHKHLTQEHYRFFPPLLERLKHQQNTTGAIQ